jgi:two-component system, OmpR family, response regulator
MAEHLLIVDDDSSLLEFLEDYFSTHGYEVAMAADGVAMRRAFAEGKIDLVILDLNLGGESGFDLAREIRGNSNTPIIMLTGRNDEMDRVVGLELGADDYVSKPFSARELLARVGAILRRTGDASASAAEDQAAPETASFCGWRIDISKRRLFSPEGEMVKLTLGEFSMLLALLRHPHQVMSREQLLNQTDKDTGEVFDRSVDIRIMRLRQKIEPDAANPSIIRTIRGVGYMFNQPVAWR